MKHNECFCVRYLKIKNSISQYLLIQYGLSCFTKSSTDNSYSCASYNFYIFPYKVPGANNYKDKSFLCQPSALTFLSGHNFDFNKWIREGISYMNLEEETHLTETLKNKNVSVNQSLHLLVENRVHSYPILGNVKAVISMVTKWSARQHRKFKPTPVDQKLKCLNKNLIGPNNFCIFIFLLATFQQNIFCDL
uniref:Uncharacterized protein n=1 Tax=Tetranychus urticae TaxID=32264 RepID=T1KBC3_TETUR